LDESKIKELLQEDPSIGAQRAYLKEKVSMLTASLNVLHKVTQDQLNNTTTV